MRLSVTTWSFPQCTLPEAAGVAAALGFEGIDLGYFYRAALDKGRLLSDPEGYGKKLKADLPLPVANLYHLFGDSPADRNLASSTAREENLRDFDRALAFCRAIGAPTVFILPGVINGAQSRSLALAHTIEAIEPMVDAGRKAGVTVCVEPHVHSYLESPALAAELCEAVPGLKLALDYAHFVVSGYRQEEIDALAPHAGHVHLRQARPGALQAKMGEGTINFPALFSTLRDAGYEGWLACEYVHQDYFGTLLEDVLTETILMRDAFTAWRDA